MNNFWKNMLLLWAVSISVDYLIATNLASSDGEKWTIFFLLMFIPWFFSLKSALIRTVMWFVAGKRDASDGVFNELISGDWPMPDTYEAENPEHYLTLVVENASVRVDTRIKAASILGVVAALDSSQQIFSKIFWSSGFKMALKRYAMVKEMEDHRGR